MFVVHQTNVLRSRRLTNVEDLPMPGTQSYMNAVSCIDAPRPEHDELRCPCLGHCVQVPSNCLCHVVVARCHVSHRGGAVVVTVSTLLAFVARVLNADDSATTLR